MSRSVLSVLFAAFAVTTVAVPSAFAGCVTCAPVVFNTCGSCYRPVYHPVVTPPQYQTVYDTVMVAPPRVVRHVVPPRFGVVNETVMVRPPSTAWQSTCACGRETVQAVEIPAEYTTVPHTVMVEPAHVVREVIPAQYGTVARTEMVAPAQTVWAQY
jgi:hypothetical protein